MQNYLVLGGIVALTVLGDYALKSASIKSVPFMTMWFIGGAMFYAATAFGWVHLMQSHNLAQIGVLYSSATILALTGVGYVIFNESVSPRQLVGICAALLSVFLMESET